MGINCAVFSIGLVDTAVKTAETGYMQRRLVKVCKQLALYLCPLPPPPCTQKQLQGMIIKSRCLHTPRLVTFVVECLNCHIANRLYPSCFMKYGTSKVDIVYTMSLKVVLLDSAPIRWSYSNMPMHTTHQMELL